MAGTGLMRCEIALMGRRETIAKLAVFLCRRTAISLMTRSAEIRRTAGREDICAIPFGDAAAERLAEYFDTETAVPASDPDDPHPPL
jgi:hypothetical protein